ncbi:uncharacterized protein LOC121404496 [Drosophila obscura]|uniref:uncharacterized protein LOC121404496 n=1 Tax=Drosophila obscura TaxID=7282 RepID=UPI001BB1F376|nr:uncharacterized protein LOC121404496 [Drosophila obscura]
MMSPLAGHKISHTAMRLVRESKAGRQRVQTPASSGGHEGLQKSWLPVIIFGGPAMSGLVALLPQRPVDGSPASLQGEVLQLLPAAAQPIYFPLASGGMATATAAATTTTNSVDLIDP